MFKLVISMLLLLTCGAGTAAAQTCLHGANETPAQKSAPRRGDPAGDAHQPGAVVTFGPALANAATGPLEELTNIPPTPQGFELQFHTDGDSYSFSIKDRMDPCRYVVFSDQDKFLYEAIARRDEPMVVPLDTR